MPGTREKSCYLRNESQLWMGSQQFQHIFEMVKALIFFTTLALILEVCMSTYSSSWFALYMTEALYLSKCFISFNYSIIIPSVFNNSRFIIVSSHEIQCMCLSIHILIAFFLFFITFCS